MCRADGTKYIATKKKRKEKEKDTSQKNDLQHIKTTFQHEDGKTPPRNATKYKQHRPNLT
jgi:hypothetical protein